jgi:hypothetical protein
MSALSTLFERFLRERRYLKNVTPKTIAWYQSAFLAFTRTVTVSGPAGIARRQSSGLRPAAHLEGSRGGGRAGQ